MVLDGALGDTQRIGDLLVGEAASHQPQDLGLAVGERIRAIQADELVAHVFQPGQQALGDRRLHQRPARRHRLDGADQLLQRDILEQVALGPGLDPGQHQRIVVEGGQDDRGRQGAGAAHGLQGLQAGHHRHPHVHQHHVRPDLRDLFHRLATVGGLGHHLDALRQGQQGTDALAHQGLVVDQEDTDRGGIARGRMGHAATPWGKPVAAFGATGKVMVSWNP